MTKKEAQKRLKEINKLLNPLELKAENTYTGKDYIKRNYGDYVIRKCGFRCFRTRYFTQFKFIYNIEEFEIAFNVAKQLQKVGLFKEIK